MAYKTITYTVEQGIAKLTFNRPQRLNAVNPVMMKEITEVLQLASNDDSLRVLILTGTGRGFCAGGDFKGDADSLVSREKATQPRNAAEWGRGVRNYIRPITLVLRNMEIPTIAMVNGVAVGQGFSMAQACDIRIGSDNAKFMVGWTNRGIAPAFGDTWLLPRIIGMGRALDLIYTARMLEAPEAFQIGLLNRLVKPEQLEEETMEYARRLAKGPPLALRADKQLVYDGMNMDLSAALNSIANVQGALIASEDWGESSIAFQEKRQPQFKGK
ncbi:MAG: enoyl-CoA hydratase/isomerase family protein [Chloroflexi bacterium]|nr:enoyl-CoA hydratase/isomerase family protein [Chloroflexota bacterium]